MLHHGFSALHCDRAGAWVITYVVILWRCRRGAAGGVCSVFNYFLNVLWYEIYGADFDRQIPACSCLRLRVEWHRALSGLSVAASLYDLSGTCYRMAASWAPSNGRRQWPFPLLSGGFPAAHASFLQVYVCLRDMCICAAHTIICMLFVCMLVVCLCAPDVFQCSWEMHSVLLLALILQVPITGPLLACTSRMAPGLEWTISSCPLCVMWGTQLALDLSCLLCCGLVPQWLHFSARLPAFEITCVPAYLHCMSLHACNWLLFVFALRVVIVLWVVGGFQNTAEIYTVCYY